MRWSLAQSLALTAVIAIVLVIFTMSRQLHESDYIYVGAYMAALAIATAANSSSLMKRFWLTFAVFVLLHFIVFQTAAAFMNRWHGFTNQLTTIVVLLGLASAFASLLLPRPIDSSPSTENKVDEKTSS